jgi:hypothetical protein
MKLKLILATFLCGFFLNMTAIAAPQGDADGQTGATTSYKKKSKKTKPANKDTTSMKKKAVGKKDTKKKK